MNQLAKKKPRTRDRVRWHCTVRPKPVPAGQTGLPNQFPADGDRSHPGTYRTGPSDRLAQASVGPCLSDHRSNTAVVALLNQPCSTSQCRQCERKPLFFPNSHVCIETPILSRTISHRVQYTT
ncbi:hypothetical protein PCASD_19289 [Puccinia coronata f. sp. avenae]|uniref:Uncharacterized protein n=1 Tax=Puccinia coronata f. sp. avenae TaxID=200324 RepID=A0A2N5SRX3_9BASI|nr:hypothetical protein PCASD_19289 [Puccinia coronata f. sp. avenae]